MSNGKRKRRNVRRETKDGKSHWEESSTKHSKKISGRHFRKGHTSTGSV